MKIVILILILMIAFTSLFAETIWQDDFEESTGWTLSGEFEIGQPQGLGGEHGLPDPVTAYAGLQVLGVDLNGIGGYPGDYENNLGTDEYSAVSPVIDCSEFLNIHLSFMKWLNVEQPAYDHAYIDVSGDDGTTWVEVWTNAATITDNSWTMSNYDISASADLKESVRIRFTIGPTDGSWQYSGWNIDNLVVTGDPLVYGAIEGNIVDSTNGNPVQFAQVASQYGNALSNEEGYFLLTGIPTGNRTITINALGFYPYEFENILVTENDTTYVLCELIENPDTPPSPQNLEAEVIEENNVQLTWEAPATRDILLAYNVYRNGYLIVSVLEEEFLDLNLVNGIYEYFVTAVYDTGESFPSNLVEIEINETGNDDGLIAPEVKLWNYPNPFNPSTTISFSLTTESTENTELVIYNLKGEKIKTLDCGNRVTANARDSRSTQSVVWNGTDEAGKPVTSGIYFYKLKSGNLEISRKCILLK
ncbi:MAG: carboxypeptidase regulatory-like domain-containing protein [Candidatus Cloacimonadales bacterium]|nr:carboxypeptidase regulatory-like domain-containing protein [Candidatus Cloacimonadales bacterium]